MAEDPVATTSQAAEKTDDVATDPTDARGGFSHKMMEQFEALRRDGYTVLLGGGDAAAAEKAGETSPRASSAEPPTCDSQEQPVTRADESKARILAGGPRPGTLDYAKFDDLDLSDDDDDDDDDLARGGGGGHDDDRAATTREPRGDADDPRTTPKLDGETERLWDRIMQLAAGDPEKARALMADPDSLQQRPEIQALYAELAQETDEATLDS